jgi:transcriptional regulator with XRE-family HTH domain
VDVGQRLKAMRTARGMSQRQLADASGVANGLISMVELNRTSPSIASMKKILSGMKVPLSEFFAIDAEADEPIFFAKDELRSISRPADGNGGAIELRQIGNAMQHQIQMLHERYEPGADTGEELYAHEAEEAGIVISGSIEVTVGGELRVLKPGDAYIFDSRKPHRFRNIGSEECVVVSACTPPSF